MGSLGYAGDADRYADGAPVMSAAPPLTSTNRLQHPLLTAPAKRAVPCCSLPPCAAGLAARQCLDLRAGRHPVSPEEYALNARVMPRTLPGTPSFADLAGELAELRAMRIYLLAALHRNRFRGAAIKQRLAQGHQKDRRLRAARGATGVRSAR